MTPLIENVWNLVKEESKRYTEDNPKFIFNQNKYKDFKKTFKTNYEEIKELPNAQSCGTPYMEIMCRNLYYAKNDYKLNPLDLADRLFLVEYIALTKEGIAPDILKDY